MATTEAPRRATAVRLLDRSATSVVAIAALCGILAALAWRQGGYFAPSYLHAGAAAFALLACLLLFRSSEFKPSREALVAIGALLALALWTWIASGWSPTPTAGVTDAQRDLVYVAIFAVAVTAAGSGRTASFAVWCALTVAMVIVIAGLGSRLDPSRLPPLHSFDAIEYRLSYPLTYWNAFGALAAMASVLAGGLAADRRTPIGLRSLAASMSVVAIVAMYLSLSRGAWLAVVAGAAVLIICSPTRGAASLTVLTVSLFATLAILKLSTALVDNPYAQPGQVVAGHAYLPKLAAFALLAGVIQAILVRAERTVRSSPTLVLAGRRIRVAVACLAAVGAIGALGLAGTAIDGKLGNVGGFISRQWNDFLHPASAPGAGTARLISAKTTRGDVYRVALDEFKAHPLFGGGSGSYATSWYAQRRYAESLQNAHSLYLETLAELGIAGAAILLAFLGSCVWTAVRSRSRPTALSRGQATAVMASTSVWAIHAGVDWDWQMSALTGLALFLVGTLFPLGARSSELEMQDESARPVRRRRRGGAWRSALRSGRHGLRSAAAALDGRGVTAARIAGVLCAFAAVYSWGSAQQAQRLQDANGLGAAGQYRAALREARSVTLSPASDQALVVEAFALQDLRHLRAAGATYAAAAAANPGDWTIRLNWAQDLAQQHRRAAARAQLRQVLRLNPLVILPPDLARLVSGGR